MKKLNIAIQMDPIANINFASDSTLLLAIEASKRGFNLFYYTPCKLTLNHGQVTAKGHLLQVRDDAADYYSLGDEQVVHLAEMDVVLIRQDPPFDMNYITATYLLEMLPATTLVVNNPSSLRDCPEKLLVCNFPELMPPTIITRDESEVREFYNQHGRIVIKPLYGHGGNDVFYVDQQDVNLDSILQIFHKFYQQYFVVQAFIPAIKDGDKRIILIDGEPIAAINRVPAANSIKSNLVAGGTAFKCELTPRDLEICGRIGPELKKRGLIFAGVDIIGDYITEINITSPTGLVAINRFHQICAESLIWDAIISKLG